MMKAKDLLLLVVIGICTVQVWNKINEMSEVGVSVIDSAINCTNQ